jgi:hypothetical protein
VLEQSTNVRLEAQYQEQLHDAHHTYNKLHDFKKDSKFSFRIQKEEKTSTIVKMLHSRILLKNPRWIIKLSRSTPMMSVGFIFLIIQQNVQFE